MRKWCLRVVVLLAFLNMGCSGFPVIYNPYGSGGYGQRSGNTAASRAQTEREYQQLIQNYHPETERVLNILLGTEEPEATETALVIRNNSQCNLVFTITAAGFLKKIPVAARDIGYATIPKTNLSFSASVCGQAFNRRENATSTLEVTLGDQ